MHDANSFRYQWREKFDAAKWRRYHAARATHYEKLDRWVSFLSIVFGSVSFANVAFFHVPAIDLAVYLGLAITVMNAAKLVFEFSRNAQLHRDMHRDFTALAVEINDTVRPDIEQCRQWESRRTQINARVFRIYWALEAHAYNQTVVEFASNRAPPIKLGLWHASLMNLRPFSNDQFKATPDKVANDLRPLSPPEPTADASPRLEAA